MNDTYVLVKHAGFDAGYLDSISPADKSLYMMYFKQEKEQERDSKSSGNNPAMQIGSGIDVG